VRDSFFFFQRGTSDERDDDSHHASFPNREGRGESEKILAR